MTIIVQTCCSHPRSSSPLPPVSRMEEKSQTRRCERLRQSLRRVFALLPGAFYRAFEEMKNLAVEADLEKYCDIYEISRTDMLEAEGFSNAETFDPEEETLKAFKIGFQKLHLTRKLFLCSLLALSTDGGSAGLAKWAIANKTMDALSVEISKITQGVDEVFRAEEGKKKLLQRLLRSVI